MPNCEGIKIDKKTTINKLLYIFYFHSFPFGRVVVIYSGNLAKGPGWTRSEVTGTPATERTARAPLK